MGLIKRLCLALLVSFSLSAVLVAQEDAAPKKQFSEKQLAQQQRMKDCSADAKEKALKGADRKAFMKTCLSGGVVDAEPAEAEAQRDKMKRCNAEAKSQELKGEARKEFMSGCLSN